MQVQSYSTGTAVGTAYTDRERSGAPSGGQVLGRDAFLKLLVAQLKNQDPLSPVDNQQFVAQLAQLQSLDELRSLGEALRLMTGLMTAGQASGLLGKKVRAETARGEVRGVVESLRLENGRIVLSTDAGEVDLSEVVEVFA